MDPNDPLSCGSFRLDPRDPKEAAACLLLVLHDAERNRDDPARVAKVLSGGWGWHFDELHTSARRADACLRRPVQSDRELFETMAATSTFIERFRRRERWRFTFPEPLSWNPEKLEAVARASLAWLVSQRKAWSDELQKSLGVEVNEEVAMPTEQDLIL